MHDLLLYLLLLPLAGALLALATPAGAVGTQRAIALGTTLVTMVLGFAACLALDGASAAAQLVVERAWLELPGPRGPIPIRLALGLDGVSVLLVALTVFLGPVVALSSFGHVHERVKEFTVWLLVMQSAMLGVFLALDLVLFYVFWELSLIPLYFMLGIWGGERRLYATIKFFLYTFAGSLVMLVAVIALIYRLGTADVPEITRLAGGLPLTEQGWIFSALALAFAIKVPVLPFHTWLADAHTEAPTSGSVILAGVLLKMGTYGLLRLCIAPFPAVALQAAPWMMAIAVLGIVYGALLALAQSDVKRLIACSSVSHLGFVVLGLFALTANGLRGGVLQMINHGLSTGLLFLLIGMIYERRHTRELDEYGGLARSVPVWSMLFVFAVLSSVGLPSLNGFVGEYLILLGTFEARPLFAALGVSGVVLGAIYLLMATRRMLFGPLTRRANGELADVGRRELWTALPVCAVILWIGVAPNFLLARTEASLDLIVRRVDEARTRVAALETGAETPALAAHASEDAR